MNQQKKPLETIVISVDGKLIVPEKINVEFLAKFKEFIIKELATNNRSFILIAGGGMVSRAYQTAAQSVVDLDDTDLDWLGIHATRLNGHLLGTILRGTAYPIIFTNPDDVQDTPRDSKVIIAAGYRPGISTDLEAVKMAIVTDAKKVINLSIDGFIYTKNPKTHTDAESISSISWSEFLKIVPDTWNPNLSTPFDPVAARLANENSIEVAQISGQDFSQLENYLANKPFLGTQIHP